MRSIKFTPQNKLFYLNQKELPLKESWLKCCGLQDGYRAIKELRVRGAPLIGVFAAYCIWVSLKNLPSSKKSFLKQFKKSLNYLKSCRPTAVNLAWALDRLDKVVLKHQAKSLDVLKQVILKEAKAIHAEDVDLCRKMGQFGSKLVKKGERILTHCNAGILATSGEGTALSVIFKAQALGKKIRVYADETRPLLQGSRLTAWELQKKKVPFSVICDNMAAGLMEKGLISKVFLGADRIAANGDAANKIGTYSVAVLAKYHKVPFYVVAPFSTFDLKLKSGKYIPIEQRPKDEVRKVLGKIYIAPKSADAYNPAFDVTPHKLITAIVSDKGIIYPPFTKNIKKVLCPKKN